MDAGTPDRISEALKNAPPSANGVLVVDLAALRKNYRTLKSVAEGASVAAVVKANAYGLGVAEATAALRKEGCDIFFVATLQEGEALRALAPGPEIFVLNGLAPGTAPRFSAASLHPVLGSIPELEEWLSHAEASSGFKGAALHLDTGMTRLGFAPAEAEAILRHPALKRVFVPRLVMTHLACADDAASPKNAAQLNLFNRLAALAPESAAPSVAASAGIFLGAVYRRGVVRPGIALYGGRPGSAGRNPMAPVVSLYGRIAQVRFAERGETAGYGAAQTLKRRSRIATVTVGYADGFFRALSASDAKDGPPGHIGSHRLPLLGRVSMDLVTYDATDAPEGLARRGGFVELLGERVTVDDLAGIAGTIGYEVLTALGSRYHRVYLDD
jgi:alanine racemase